MKVIVLPFAEADIKDSIGYYSLVNEDLVNHFVKGINNSFNDICKNPTAYPIVKKEI